MEELIPITMFAMIGIVLVLRPITKPLGRLLESMARDRHSRTEQPAAAAGEAAQLRRVADLLEQLDTRIDLIEDRIGFVERLVDSGQRARGHLGAGARQPAAG